MRPRSQRFVDGNGIGGASERRAAGARTDRRRGRRAPLLGGVAAPRRDRAFPASRRPRPAHRRPEVHDGVGPVAGPVDRHGPVGEGLHLRCAQPVRGAGDEATEHATNVDVDRADRSAVRDGRHGAGGVRPDTGQRLEPVDRVRDPAVEGLGDDPGGPPQGEAAPVVPQALPLAQHVGRRRRREIAHGREADHPAFPVGRRACRLGLLGHRLRDQDGVRVGRASEGERPAVRRRTRRGSRRARPPGSPAS